eukprot:TRINITY_DN29335_c0_g1_i3.p1 TRINITY_DN29335_c0_g1~~TRINITY_DN29335_c0_g1_i3.p1  ORF type:complete len:313 (+),score=35.96 TRINITY_DN29335_c0_g1_i3:63-1001(+)
MTVRTTDKATKSDVKATKDPQGERSDGLDMAVKAVAPSKNLGALVSLEHHANYLVKLIGAPSDELCSPWVRWLAMLNGVLHFGVFVVQFVDRARFPTKRGEKKVATFEVMNDKYVGLQFAALVLHILSGTISHFGSSAAIALEDYWPKVAQRLAVLSSAAELGVHSPSALCMSPFVYGDKGVTPLVYALVSCLLGLSGASALSESLRSEPGRAGPRPELRRMNATISIFLYVRLYAMVRGLGGFLSTQKHSLAVMTSGTVMLPVAWARMLFPLTFYIAGLYNWRTTLWTIQSVVYRGVDATARMQAKRLRRK